MESTIKKLGLLLLILGMLAFTSMFVAIVLSFAGSTELTNGNVAVIPITGLITTASDPWSATVDPQFVREAIERAENDDRVKAIVLEINSPGGSAVASDEIGQALRLTEKPTVSWIREAGASGGYWIASNTDHIIANRMSITGSVGVTASYIEFAGTLRRYNASYVELHSGEYKELGNPFDYLTEEEHALLQTKIDRIHVFFLDEVQQNRNLTDEQMAAVRTGEFYIGAEAYDLGLVDELGSFPEVEAYVEELIGEEPVFTRYEKPQGLLQGLGFVKQDFLPDGSLAIRT